MAVLSDCDHVISTTFAVQSKVPASWREECSSSERHGGAGH